MLRLTADSPDIGSLARARIERLLEKEAGMRGDTELVTHALGNVRRRVLTETGW